MRRSLTIAIAAAASAAAVAAAAAAMQQPSEQLTGTAELSISRCLAPEDPDAVISCLQDRLTQLADIYRREAVLQAMYEQAIATTDRTGEDCHSKMHLVGMIAGRLYLHDALLEGMGDCDDGYYHGAITAYSLEDRIDQVCRRLQRPEENLACWHGYGHLAWVSSGGGGWEACEQAAHTPQKAECIAGIGMEAAISLGAEGIDVCARQYSGTFLYSCAVGAANNAGAEDPLRVVEACGRLPEHQDACYRAAGSGIATHLAIRGLEADALPEAVEPCLAKPSCRSGLLSRNLP